MTGPNEVFKGIAYDGSDSPSAIAKDAIHPDVGATRTSGAAPASHPELSQDHRDAQLVKIAAVESNGEYAAVPDGSNPEQLRGFAGGAFLPSDFLEHGQPEGN